MERISIGKTGIELSALGMGTIQITRLPWEESIRVVQDVHRLGVTWFDTAQGYLDSELRLGEAVHAFRDDVVLMTKSGAREPNKLREAIEASLKRLATSYIDIFLFHGGGAVQESGFADSGGLLETAREYVRRGKIKCLGFSAHRPEIALKALEFDELVIGMVPANFINREYIDAEFMERARSRGVTVIAMKPLGGGRIRAAGPSIRFLKQYPGLVPCIGIENAEEMRDNINYWDDDQTFSAEDESILSAERKVLGDRFCRMCGYCLPCPEDIPIPTVNFLEVFSMQMPRDRVITEKHTEAVEKVALCTECRTCVERCPYDLDIPAMIRANADFYREFVRSESSSPTE